MNAPPPKLLENANPPDTTAQPNDISVRQRTENSGQTEVQHARLARLALDEKSLETLDKGILGIILTSYHLALSAH